MENNNEATPRPWDPEPYQIHGVEFLVGRGAAGLFWPPGLRKTSSTLKAIKTLRDTGQIRLTLVVAPLRPCYLVWPKEIQKWREFNDLSYVVLHGDLRKRERLLEEKKDIYIINPGGLPWLLADKLRLRRMGIDALVIDESSSFKHANTQRFKLLKPFLPQFKRRYILTGTPNPNGYLDIFGQIYILDLGGALSPYYSHYRNNYFYAVDKFGWKWNLMPGADQLIQRQIKPLILCLDDKDYIKLPAFVGVAGDPTEHQIKVELPPAARKTYDQLEEDMIARVGDRTVLAVNAGVVTQKCAQVANGGLYCDEPPGAELTARAPRATLQLHDAKTEALQELIDELNGAPLLVLYEYHHDLERLHRALFPKLALRDVPYLGGGVTPKRTDELVRRWNQSELPLLLGHPAAMGHGLNLQEGGNQICWYSIPWDLEMYYQTNRRIRRSGSPHAKVFVHHLVAEATVDVAKMAALRRKDKTQRGLLDALKEYVGTRKKKGK